MKLTSSPFDAGANLPAPPSSLPPVDQLVNEAIADVRDHFKDHAMAGLGFAVVQLPIVVLAVVSIYGGMGLGMYIALQQDDTDLVWPAGMGGLLVGLLATMAIAGVLVPPLAASLHRAVWAWQVDGTPLTFGSAFSTIRQDLARVYLMTAALGTAIGLGVMACYLPGLILAFLLHFAWSRVVIHRVGIGQALRDSWDCVVREPGWNLGVFALGMILSMIVANIPLLGLVFAQVLGASWTLRTYRAAFAEPIEAM